MKSPGSRSIWEWLLSLVLFVVWVFVLEACSRSQQAMAIFHARDISGVMPALDFNLISQNGTKVTAADLKGKTTLLYFGYTSCPDVCPTTLSNLAQALRRLGPKASSVRVLFVSVDPGRDSVQVLRRYTSAFGPQFVGLTGDDRQLTSLTKRYRVAYRRGAPDVNGDYAVYHSSAVFVFDADGRVRLLAAPSETTEHLAEDLRAMVTRSARTGP
jgi:protein SCO1/2